MVFQLKLPENVGIHQEIALVVLDQGQTETRQIVISGRSNLAALLRRLRVRNPVGRNVEITRKGKAPSFEYEAKLL